MKSWDLTSMAVHPHSPEILDSGDCGRAIVLEIPGGESLQDHQVHEHAWVTVISGEVAIEAGAQTTSGGVGLVAEFAPAERHAVHARTAARLLLLLTPWPGDGHPGAMALDDKQTVRERAAAHNRAA